MTYIQPEPYNQEDYKTEEYFLKPEVNEDNS